MCCEIGLSCLDVWHNVLPVDHMEISQSWAIVSLGIQKRVASAFFSSLVHCPVIHHEQQLKNNAENADGNGFWSR